MDSILIFTLCFGVSTNDHEYKCQTHTQEMYNTTVEQCNIQSMFYIPDFINKNYPAYQYVNVKSWSCMSDA